MSMPADCARVPFREGFGVCTTWPFRFAIERASLPEWTWYPTMNVYPRSRPGEASLLRLVLGIQIAQHPGCFNELVVLRNGPACRIALRQKNSSAMSAPTTPSGVQVLTAMSTLLPLEVDALRHSISGELLTKMGWSVDAKTGRVSKDGHAIFRAGFATTIKKVLNAV